MKNKAEKMKTQLQVLRVKYQQKLPEKMQFFTALFEELSLQIKADDQLQIQKTLNEIQINAHKLAGSSGTYGFLELSNLLRKIELDCEKLCSQDEINAIEIYAILAKESLLKENFLFFSEQKILNESELSDIDPDKKTINANKTKIILVEDDPQQSRILSHLLINFGFRIKVLESPDLLEEEISAFDPDILIMDIIFPNGNKEGLTSIQNLRKKTNIAIPVIFLSIRDDFEARIEAIRAGSDGFLTKPVDIIELVETINRLIFKYTNPTFRVLIVDDDPEMTEFCRVVLSEGGIVSKTLNEPMRVIEELKSFQPDLLLLDIEMPNVNGLEIAEAIRQMGDATVQLPILFLTQKNDQDTHLNATKAGADDFITKPVDPDYLLKTVLLRAQYSKVFVDLFSKLSASKKRFRSITHLASEAIISVNDRGLIISWNVSASKLFGYGELDILGKELKILIPDKYKERHRVGFEKYLETGDSHFIGRSIELEGKHRDGHIFPIEISISSWDAEGKPMFAAIVWDISQQKLTEKNLIESKIKSEEADHLKSSFLANMSHELRTPLNSIMGFAELMMSEVTDPEHIEYLNTINKSGALLLAIVNDILDISKIESGELTLEKLSVSVSEFMELSAANATSLVSKKNSSLEIKTSFDLDTDIYIQADPIRLQQIMNNLISNAVKFTDTGSVHIGVKLGEENTIIFFIYDTGKGIPENKYKDIYKPFRQSDMTDTRIFGGTGLGLAITKKLVEMMDGEIWFESRVDKNHGTDFYFSIPLVILNPNQTLSDPSLESVSGTSNIKILVVDDNEVNLKLATIILKKLGYESLTAHNGQDAIDLLQDKKDIDIVIMDVQMPILDGISAVKKIRAIEINENKNPGIPIIALTAAAMKEDEERCLKAGFTDYLAKPFTKKQINSMIKKYLQ